MQVDAARMLTSVADLVEPQVSLLDGPMTPVRLLAQDHLREAGSDLVSVLGQAGIIQPTLLDDLVEMLDTRDRLVDVLVVSGAMSASTWPTTVQSPDTAHVVDCRRCRNTAQVRRSIDVTMHGVTASRFHSCHSCQN